MCINLYCFAAQLQRRCRANMLPVAAGDRVIAKHRNGRYYRALVLSFSDVVYYKVAFDDGTYSNDMYPEDIEASTAKFERFWFQNLCLKKIKETLDELFVGKRTA